MLIPCKHSYHASQEPASDSSTLSRADNQCFPTAGCLHCSFSSHGTATSGWFLLLGESVQMIFMYSGPIACSLSY